MSTGRTEVISLVQAKQHLRMPLDVTQDDDSLYVLLEIAHGLVFDKCKSYCAAEDDAGIAAAYAAVDAWTSDTAPPGVRAAILETLSDLDRNRGDASNRDSAPRYHSLSPRAEGFLALVRDPVLR